MGSEAFLSPPKKERPGECSLSLVLSSRPGGPPLDSPLSSFSCGRISLLYRVRALRFPIFFSLILSRNEKTRDGDREGRVQELPQIFFQKKKQRGPKSRRVRKKKGVKRGHKPPLPYSSFFVLRKDVPRGTALRPVAHTRSLVQRARLCPAPLIDIAYSERGTGLTSHPFEPGPALSFSNERERSDCGEWHLVYARFALSNSRPRGVPLAAACANGFQRKFRVRGGRNGVLVPPFMSIKDFMSHGQAIFVFGSSRPPLFHPTL